MSGALVASAQPVAKPATPSASAAKRAVEVELTQFKVVKAIDGTEHLQDAASVKPGDIIEYHATYTNQSGKPVTRLVADLPIPDGLEYLPKSAKPGASLVKMAGRDGVFGVEPLMRQINGKSEPVPYRDYRSLRWELEQLPAGGVTAVTARARVEEVSPPAGAASAGSVHAPPVKSSAVSATH